MAKQSLFQACKRLFRDGISGTYEVGTKDIFLELYTQEDIDGGVTIGDSSEENIVVVAGGEITIPSGYTLTPVQPKKSLVIICNSLVNNGTISMYQKAPNVLPHDLFIIDKNNFGGSKDIIVPAYAENQVPRRYQSARLYQGSNGNNGTNRNCGSGGTGSMEQDSTSYYGHIGASGSGYAFGGGAGSGGGRFVPSDLNSPDVDTTYPMISGASSSGRGQAGVGNPAKSSNAFGCGGRVIIFCTSFENNGNITVNGTDTISSYSDAGWGGASGAGAIDVFYTSLVKEGTITANGGNNYTKSGCTPGKGGNGSITLSAWTRDSVLKPISKYMSKDNMVYFLNQYISRLAGGED